jgi:hypothetical protein
LVKVEKVVSLIENEIGLKEEKWISLKKS